MSENSVFMGKFRSVMIGGVAVIILGFGGLIFALMQTTKPAEVEKDDGPTTAGISGGASSGDASPAPGDGNFTEKVPGQSFEGKGAKAITFKAGGGLAVIRLSHRGSANFVVQYGKGTSANTLLVNEIGKYDGSKAVGLEAGDYTLNVDTAGEWAVEVDQRTPANAVSPPQTFTGKGQSATPFFNLKAGQVTFRLNHKGNALFSPFLLRSDGTAVTLLANGVGDFNGQKTVSISEDGVYLVDVAASGDWTIEVT